MALQMVGPSDLRKYNPDRDMLWSLHTYFRRALVLFGDGSEETLQKLLAAHGIKCPEGEMRPDMERFIKRITSVLADPLLKDVKDPGMVGANLLQVVYAKDTDAYNAIRTLFSVMFLKGLICEYPLWCAMTRPKHPNDPLPSQDEINEAADEFLAKISSEGDATRGE